ncbi:predicted protein [Verticillium alfalfae VaMs.102]|uniref:Predicted protein n=1 Tax=Verticillium alfalfae (strain VaMs.102 / ATCC MYA-4576 / FGSC 10136) TaxID=526221 RepID=C9SYB4_VERA1|nr:predicted protein [Verticillium alfalfae VaMs.102]EEY23779.1 predicted protein [Verticillium alfalfae VaMs.102]
MCNPTDVVYLCHGGTFCQGGPNGTRAVTAVKPWMDRGAIRRPRQPFQLCEYTKAQSGRYHNFASEELGIDGFQPTRLLSPIMARINQGCRKAEAVQVVAKDGWEWTAVSELDRWTAEMQRVNPGVFDDLERWRKEAQENDPAMFEDLDEVDEQDGLGGQ